MLEMVDLDASLDKETYQTLQDALDVRLGALQRELKAAGIPLVVVFEGWDASGKGDLINRLLRPLDPRLFKVQATSPPTVEETLRPPMWRFWRTLPNDGDMAIYDRSWYRQVLDDRVDGVIPQEACGAAYDRIRTFERQLADHGAVIVKFWLHISRKEQGKRFKKLEKDEALAWKVTKEDRCRHRQYNQYCLAVEDMLRETSTPYAPWKAVPAHDQRYAAVQIAETIAAAAATALERPDDAPDPEPIRVERRTSPLDRVDLSLSVPRDEYDERLPRLQAELRRLEHIIYVKRIPVVIVYEGWDAAGKGGNIRRMTRELDPRGYEVVPIGPPTGHEKTHHYLWRFWTAVPKAGHIAIFDRSWYGRVMVERIEGFAAHSEWQRAYREICEFEHELVQFGTVLAKFWLHISPEEQLSRFQARESTPHKSWKITPDDWRNREKWDDYWGAVSDMIERTSTVEAPWTIVEGNDKRHARLKTLETVIAAIEERL